jgi:para-nitrobenzyl esterase
MPDRPIRRVQPLVIATLCFALACGDDDAQPDAAVASSAGAGGSVADPARVQTEAGVVRGKQSGAATAFLGIPYAKPPVGERRWRSPEPADGWTDERDASEPPPMCPQPDGGSEDCLYLNVWAPKPTEALRPTMVWLHGGAFIIGSANMNDGSALAADGDVVVVAVNYRLGALGFLAHAALSADPEGRGSSGNYGLEDQVLALRWVKDNIRAFGGDPDNVTLFGESAGSACTCALLGTPSASGLFHRAIMESGACLGFESNLADAEVRGNETVSKLACAGSDALSCLRAKTAAEVSNAASDLIDALTHQRWRPIIDGVFIPPVTETSVVKVPIIIGTNRDEGGQFGLLALNDAAYTARAEGYYPNPDDAKRVLKAYSAAELGSTVAFSTLVTDSLFVCPTRYLARIAANAGVDTYVYSFAYGTAYHADEVPYVFGLVDASDEAKNLSARMLRAWTTFARTGDPNSGMDPTWPKYDAASDQYMVFDVTDSVSSGLKRDACDLLDTLPPLHF